MGATPNMRVKGLSHVRYNFLWDPAIRHYAYEPKDQKEVDDIFRTQGRTSHVIFYSVWMDPEPVVEPVVEMIGTEIEKAPARKKKAKSKQPVVA